MKLSRIVLVCTLLLLAAVPSFAAPPCRSCLDDVGPCFEDPGSGTRCRFVGGACETFLAFCIDRADTTVLAEWKIASIEVNRPDADQRLTKVVITPASVAKAETPQPGASQ